MRILNLIKIYYNEKCLTKHYSRFLINKVVTKGSYITKRLGGILVT